MGEMAIWLGIVLLCCIFTHLWLVKIRPNTRVIHCNDMDSPTLETSVTHTSCFTMGAYGSSNSDWSSKLTLYVNVLLTINSPSAISLLATDTYNTDSKRSQNWPFLIVFLPYALALFPGLAWLHSSFWSSSSVCKNGARRPGESYHVIRGTGVTFVTLHVYSHATVKTDLMFCTSYEDETSADREQHQACKPYPS